MDKSVFRTLTYGMYVLATRNGDNYSGCIVNTVFQLTSEPPIIGVSVSKDNYTHDLIMKEKTFTASIISENTPVAVINTFGFRSGRKINKFENFQYKMLPSNLPYVTEKTCGWLECEVMETVELPTHTVFISKVLDSGVLDRETPMTYAYYHHVIKGNAPKNAPTHLTEDVPDPTKPADENDAGDKTNATAGAAKEKRMAYVCSVCGHIYDGDIPFEQLPEDWMCPTCGEGKENFILKEI
ncbi:High molecular weight rubredoxin [Methanosarcinaceae archaeon Ag5]|uniref:High molecular weight rubredoxin n=1 Tax=Methanolapillus africanus TaxID=3028297 RepID=A0AAE4MJJ3_9EURY|nr:High molecular weight rubredoxin [Methanosarcinaceae archaeon Ag5]